MVAEEELAASICGMEEGGVDETCSLSSSWSSWWSCRLSSRAMRESSDGSIRGSVRARCGTKESKRRRRLVHRRTDGGGDCGKAEAAERCREATAEGGDEDGSGAEGCSGVVMAVDVGTDGEGDDTPQSCLAVRARVGGGGIRRMSGRTCGSERARFMTEVEEDGRTGTRGQRAEIGGQGFGCMEATKTKMRDEMGSGGGGGDVVNSRE